MEYLDILMFQMNIMKQLFLGGKEDIISKLKKNGLFFQLVLSHQYQAWLED